MPGCSCLDLWLQKWWVKHGKRMVLAFYVLGSLSRTLLHRNSSAQFTTVHWRGSKNKISVVAVSYAFHVRFDCFRRTATPPKFGFNDNNSLQLPLTRPTKSAPCISTSRPATESGFKQNSISTLLLLPQVLLLLLLLLVLLLLLLLLLLLVPVRHIFTTYFIS